MAHSGVTAQIGLPRLGARVRIPSPAPKSAEICGFENRQFSDNRKSAIYGSHTDTRYQERILEKSQATEAMDSLSDSPDEKSVTGKNILKSKSFRDGGIYLLLRGDYKKPTWMCRVKAPGMTGRGASMRVAATAPALTPCLRISIDAAPQGT
ncbi:hypothetical protein WG907_06535 [Sphingobium sp. AN558]|uniref:hypothetical protein n=1 Tax=Sphingobium sp. AN558 TaxID=3133442 RepID=UPI0030BFC9EE